MLTKLHDKVLGAYLGCAVGDAMGAPTETRPTNLIKKHVGNGDYVFDIVTPRSDTLSAGQPRGMVTDDFSVSYLSTIEFLKDGGIYKSAAERALIKWKEYDRYYLPHSGPTSKKAIEKLMGLSIDNRLDYVATDNASATNGAGMKSWVAGVFNPGNIEKAVSDAIIMCKVTHDNPIALSAASAVAAAVSIAMVNDSSISDVLEAGIYGSIIGLEKSKQFCKPSAGASVERRLKMAASIGINYAHDFDQLLKEMADLVGTGLNANEAIPAAFGFFLAAKGNPMKAIYMGVNCGYDTDTIAAIAGAISGAYSGTSSFHEEHVSLIESVNEFNIKKTAEEVYQFICNHDESNKNSNVK